MCHFFNVLFLQCTLTSIVWKYDIEFTKFNHPPHRPVGYWNSQGNIGLSYLMNCNLLFCPQGCEWNVVLITILSDKLR